MEWAAGMVNQNQSQGDIATTGQPSAPTIGRMETAGAEITAAVHVAAIPDALEATRVIPDRGEIQNGGEGGRLTSGGDISGGMSTDDGPGVGIGT